MPQRAGADSRRTFPYVLVVAEDGRLHLQPEHLISGYLDLGVFDQVHIGDSRHFHGAAVVPSTWPGS